MPEGLEIEYYRRLAERTVARPIARVDTPDAWYLKAGVGAAELAGTLEGAQFTAARRIGKLLLLDVDVAPDDAPADARAVGTGDRDPAGPVLGLRFGMTGVLEVDDERALEKLQYSGTRHDPAWIRFRVVFADGGTLVMRDPRRLGGVELDPRVDRLGPDALSITPAQLRDALAGSDAPLKARLLDQARVAGLGNLLTDEILWRAGLDPARPAGGLDDRERRRLLTHTRTVLTDLFERGGSHTGDLMGARTRGGHCPRCGTALQRRTIGGRTTYSCPRHQR